MDREDSIYLQHTLDAITSIENYVRNSEKVAFLANPMLQDAVIRQLEIVGEATKRLSKPFRDRYPATPWSDIVGMRNKLSHDYFGVDLDMVWQTTIDDIPALKTTLLGAIQG